METVKPTNESVSDTFKIIKHLESNGFVKVLREDLPKETNPFYVVLRKDSAEFWIDIRNSRWSFITESGSMKMGEGYENYEFDIINGPVV